MYYTEYVRHCMRFYTAYPDFDEIIFKSEHDEENWKACESAVRNLTPYRAELICEIYKGRDTVKNNIERIARERHINESEIWRIVCSFERRVAAIRGLL